MEESIALYEAEGDTHAAARVSGRLGQVDAFTGHRDEALARMERAFAVIADDEPDEDLALLAARLAVGYWFGGDLERAAEHAELALDLAERKSTRLNSSHGSISYAVFCLKKKKKQI